VFQKKQQITDFIIPKIHYNQFSIFWIHGIYVKKMCETKVAQNVSSYLFWRNLKEGDRAQKHHFGLLIDR